MTPSMLISKHPNPLFIIGMRRSGTSMLRRILEMAHDVKLLFEPRDVWWSVTQGHLTRFCGCVTATEPAHRFDTFLREGGTRGAKFALDPGWASMYWRWLERRFIEPRYVFIRRDWRDTYQSYVKIDGDSVQGAAPAEIHSWFHTELYDEWGEFTRANTDRAVFVEYEDVVNDTHAALAPVWAMLGREPDAAQVGRFIRMPEQRSALETSA